MSDEYLVRLELTPESRNLSPDKAREAAARLVGQEILNDGRGGAFVVLGAEYHEGEGKHGLGRILCRCDRRAIA